MSHPSSERCRAKALEAEKRGREVANRDFKCEWEDIAIERHALAKRAAPEAQRVKFETN
jgi:hypothetical protein